MNEKRTLMEQKGKLGLWKVNVQEEGIRYRITDDGCGYSNSIEELSSYYNNGDDIGLVNKILEKENKILFENCVSGAETTYEEYMEQFKKDEDFPILPYVNFKSYEKAKEIWDLLETF